MKLMLYTLTIILLLALPANATNIKLKSAGCKTEAILMDALCSNYPEAKIKSGRTGNKKALFLLADGKIDFAFTCKPMSKLINKFKIPAEKTKDWKCIAFAKDPLVVVINPDAGISDISLANLSKIFTGLIHNWKEIGGNDLAIKIGYMDTKKVETGNNTVFKECTLQKYVDSSGKVSGELNKELNIKADLSKKATILDSPDKLGNFIKATPGSITFMGLNSYKKKYGTALKIAGIEPTINTVRSGKYPMAVTYHLIFSSSSSEDVKKFINYTLSDKGKTITSNNFVAITPKETK